MLLPFRLLNLKFAPSGLPGRYYVLILRSWVQEARDKEKKGDTEAVDSIRVEYLTGRKLQIGMERRPESCD